uniref:Uncharacterized protein n=1 Tax=Strigamia maritima TaxID=126957 RepID=T1IW64_STRMM
MSLQAFLSDVTTTQARVLPSLVLLAVAVIWLLWRCQATKTSTSWAENRKMEMAFSNSAFFDDLDDDDSTQDDCFYDSPRVSVLDTIAEETSEELHLDEIGAGDFITKMCDVSSMSACTNEWLKESFMYSDKRDLDWRTRVFDDLMASTDGVKRHRSRSLEDITKDVISDKGLSFEAPPGIGVFEIKFQNHPNTPVYTPKSRKISKNFFKEDFSDEEDDFSRSGSLTSKFVCQDLTQIDELERDSPRQPRPSNENLSQDSGFCDVGQPEVNLMDTIGEECEKRPNEEMELNKTMEMQQMMWMSDTKSSFTFQELGDIEDDSWSGGLLQKEWEKSIQSGRATTDDWLTYGPQVVQRAKVTKNWKSLPCLCVPETKNEPTFDQSVKTSLEFNDAAANDISDGEEMDDLKIVEEEIDKSVDLRNVFAECRKRVQEGRDRVAKSVSNLTQVERCVREQLELQMRSSKCQSVGYLETDLDTMQSRAVDETNMDQVMGSIKTASKTLSLLTLPRPSKPEEEKTRSLEFLLNEENRKSVQPPENQLRNDGQRSLSQHELRIRKSLQNLDVPEWLKKSLHTNGFILKRKNGSYLGAISPRNSIPPAVKTNIVPNFCWRYHGSVTNTPSPAKVDARQPYLGWRSTEKINQKMSNFYQSPAERLSAAPGYYALKYGTYNTDNNTDYNNHTSEINNVKPRRQRVIWIESSFVGIKNKNLPDVISES